MSLFLALSLSPTRIPPHARGRRNDMLGFQCVLSSFSFTASVLAWFACSCFFVTGGSSVRCACPRCTRCVFVYAMHDEFFSGILCTHHYRRQWSQLMVPWRTSSVGCARSKVEPQERVTRACGGDVVRSWWDSCGLPPSPRPYSRHRSSRTLGWLWLRVPETGCADVRLTAVHGLRAMGLSATGAVEAVEERAQRDCNFQVRAAAVQTLICRTRTVPLDLVSRARLDRARRVRRFLLGSIKVEAAFVGVRSGS